MENEKTEVPTPIPIGRQPYEETTQAEQPPTAAPAVEAVPEPEPEREPERNPFKQWWIAAKDSREARKARGNGKKAPMRWMYEQPTSVARYWDYYLHEREARPDGKPGWGWTTKIDKLNQAQAIFYITYGMFIGLPLTLVGYALTRVIQRPLCGIGLIIGAVIILTNISRYTAGLS